MNAFTAVTAVLELISGMGIFLVACSMLCDSLRSLGGNRLFSLLSAASDRKLVNVGIGTAVTAALQSSSAVTVAVIGAVDAGIVTLTQAAGIVFGANIGTTVTGFFVALGSFGGNGISAMTVFAALTAVGAAISAFCRGDGKKHAGGAIAGFGMIFAGLSVMSGAMTEFAQSDAARTFLTVFDSPLPLILIGCLATAVIQSSSAMTCMVIASMAAGLITLDQGIYITIGSNVGTCATALLAAAASGKNARRVALLHLIFNLGGAAIFAAIGMILRIFGIEYGAIMTAIAPYSPQMQLAAFNIIFNLATVAAALPATDALVKLTVKLAPDKPRKKRRLRKQPD